MDISSYLHPPEEKFATAEEHPQPWWNETYGEPRMWPADSPSAAEFSRLHRYDVKVLISLSEAYQRTGHQLHFVELREQIEELNV